MDWRDTPYITSQAGPEVCEGQTVRVASSPYCSFPVGTEGQVVAVRHRGTKYEVWRVEAQGIESRLFYASELEPLTTTRAMRRRAEREAQKAAKRAARRVAA